MLLLLYSLSTQPKKKSKQGLIKNKATELVAFNTIASHV